MKDTSEKTIYPGWYKKSGQNPCFLACTGKAELYSTFVMLSYGSRQDNVPSQLCN